MDIACATAALFATLADQEQVQGFALASQRRGNGIPVDQHRCSIGIGGADGPVVTINQHHAAGDAPHHQGQGFLTIEGSGNGLSPLEGDLQLLVGWVVVGRQQGLAGLGQYR